MAVITSIAELAPSAQGVIKSIAPQPQAQAPDFMTTILKLSENIVKITQNIETLKGVGGRIMEKKAPKDDNTVMYSPPQRPQADYVHAQNAPAQAQQQVKLIEEKPMPINDQKIAEYTEALIHKAKNDIPEKYKKMTVEEIIKEYDGSNVFVQGFIKSTIQANIKEMVEFVTK